MVLEERKRARVTPLNDADPLRIRNAVPTIQMCICIHNMRIHISKLRIHGGNGSHRCNASNQQQGLGGGAMDVAPPWSAVTSAPPYPATAPADCDTGGAAHQR